MSRKRQKIKIKFVHSGADIRSNCEKENQLGKWQLCALEATMEPSPRNQRLVFDSADREIQRIKDQIDAALMRAVIDKRKKP